MADFTHSFEFKVDNVSIEGEVEFNTDGQTSYKTHEPLPKMTMEELAVFNDLFIYMKRVFNKFGDFDKIEVKKL